MPDKPIVLMPEDIQRIMGKDAQRNNILAAKMVAEMIKTTLGPKGMDKMLVSPTNDIIITNDGVTILNEMQIEHPAAKMMVEIAKTQESEIGDGTTTAVMIAGKLLENAEKLLDKKIHPTVITKGYKMASEKCQEILREVAIRVSPEDEELLKQIAMTAITGKSAESSKEKLAEIIVKSLKQIEDEGKININDIKIEKAKGNGVSNTELIYGIVIDKEKISQDMPEKINDARIALVDVPIEIKNPEMNTRISITSPDQIQKFLSNEEDTLKEMVKKIKSSGANVIFCQKGIDDFAKYLLSKEGIYACRRVSKDDMEKISKATGAKIVSDIKAITPFEIGYARIVEEVQQGEEMLTFIRGCQNPKSVTILIHGGTEHVIDEIERAIKDGIGDVASVLKSKMIVPGGGAIEIEVARRLRHFGQSLSGREQLAVEEFASALEYIPITLAENAGLDPIDILTELKSKHDSGNRNIGLNLLVNKIEDVFNSRIIEPYQIKSQAITSATEVAVMILRIDDVIAANSKSKNGSMNFSGRMPQGMGGDLD
jgi:thermosome